MGNFLSVNIEFNSLSEQAVPIHFHLIPLIPQNIYLKSQKY